jgi:serine/threonine-protein kinase
VSEPKEASALLSVAAAISDGDGIDWLELEHQPAAGHDTEVLRELRLLDQIAAFHRSMEPLPADNVAHGGPVEGSLSPTWPSADRIGASLSDENDADLQSWGHLEILGKVGEGAFGAVYRARDSQLQREVALKLLWPGASAANPARALKEARLLARIRHPNVAIVHGADHIGGRVGLWMELVKGRTLAQLLQTHGPFGAREAALVGMDLCRAVAAVHAAGLLHGDIKAHNVMREEGGRTVLMDFGTGKDLTLDRSHRDTGPVNDFAGTPLYLAPEVFERQPRTKATDIYSLGVLLYHLVTDSYPVEGRTLEEVQAAHRRQERHQLRDVRPDLPEEFVQAVQRALDPDPRHRYQTTGAFESALARLLGATPAIEGGWLTSNVRRIVFAVSAVAILATMGVAYLAIDHRAPQAGAAVPSAAPSPHPVPADAGPVYQIETALYRTTNGPAVRLRAGARVEPGAELYAEVRTSAPTYVYVVNEDEKGESNVLFPLRGQSGMNPLPAGKTNRLPGVIGNWVVDKAGGREHFLIFASPDRLEAFEQAFATLPHAEPGKPVQPIRVSKEAVGQLRSVGGVTQISTTAPPVAGTFTQLFPTPLGDAEETARGLWVRQLTLDNPTK